MAFSASTETTPNGVAKITLVGELDASSAPIFRAEIDKAIAAHAKRLVLLMQDLDFMASAGLRMLVFAKQKVGNGVEIYVIAPQEPVKETMRMTGFQYSVITLDKYDASEIENI